MLQIIEAEIFHGFQSSGLSKPGRLTCSSVDGKEIDVIVKFRGSVRNGEFSLFAEAFCSMLAGKLDLPTPQAFAVNFTPEFVDASNKRFGDIFKRSLGLNFGSKYLSPAFAVVAANSPIKAELQDVAAEIFAFDIVVQNYDRQSDNPNLLCNGNNLMMIDHETALFPILKTGLPFSFDSLKFDHYYRHTFCECLSRARTKYVRFCQILGVITTNEIDEIITQIPTAWHPHRKDRDLIVEYLKWIIVKRSEVCQILLDKFG